jgi:L-lactate dehydrogenase complex protein LldG
LADSVPTQGGTDTGSETGDRPRRASPEATTPRERVLNRIRAATGVVAGASRDVAAHYAALPRGCLRAHHDPATHDIAALFAERAADYRAVVEQVPEAALSDAIARVLADRAGPACGRFVVPADLTPDWLAQLAEAAPAVVLASDDPPLSAAELDSCAGVITGCAVAIAETGTIVLDHGPGQGRRALTLIPDFHLVIVRHNQIVPDLPDALARMDPARPQTLIAGPSATSDIELVRVEGVHGPRTLHVLISADTGPGE